MTKLIKILFLLLTLLSLSCKTENNQDLITVGNIIVKHADSALHILTKIDPQQLSSADDAKYRVLLSHAYTKTHVKIASDSIIAPAVAYYEKESGNGVDLAEALYCLAQVQVNEAKVKNATESYLKALVLLKEIEKDSVEMMLYGTILHHLGSLYFEQDYYTEAKSYFSQAFEIFNKVDPEVALNSQFMMAMTTMSAGNIEASVELLEKLRASTKDEALSIWLDLIIINSSIHSDIDLFSPQRLLEMRDSIDYKEVVNLNKSYSNMEWSESPIFVYNTISAFIFYRNGMLQKALEYIEKSVEQISENAALNLGYYKSASEIARAAGDMEKALKYQQIYSIKSDSLHNVMREQQVRGVEAEFHRKSANTLRVTQLRYRLYIGAMVALLLIGATLWIVMAYRRRLRKQELQISEYLTIIESYKETTNNFTEQLQESDARESVIKKYLATRRDMVQQIAATYYTYGETNHFAEKMRDLALSKEMLADIVRMTDLYSNGAVSGLKASFKNWTVKNYNFAALVIAGFSAQEISVMLGMTLGGVYTQKSKLKRKILESPEPKVREFLDYFS